MKQTCVVTLLMIILLARPAMGEAAPDTVLFYSNPVLGRPTDSSVTVSVLPKKNMQVYIDAGTAPGIYNIHTPVQAAIAEVSYRCLINNLLPDTRYFYRLCYKVPGASQFIPGDEFSFYTRRAKGRAFKFAILADSHLYDKKGIPAMMRVTLDNLLKDQTDFVIDLGDTFGNDHFPDSITQKEMMELHRNFLPYIGTVCHSSHFYFCLGNHEGENGYYLLQNPPNNIAVYATLARKYYYTNPVPNSFYSGNRTEENFGMGLPENYYAWEWGDALFVVLDAYRGYTANAKPKNWDWTFGQEQYFWFKNVLETSRAKFKFVFAHHVLGENRGGISIANLFEWGGYENNGTTWGFASKRPGWDVPIHQLMARNGVNIFFQGHDHLFAQEILDDVVYQEAPMPSDSTYMIGMLANADAYTSNQIDGTGHLLVTVESQQTKVEYIKAYLPRDTNSTRQNRSTAFSYTVMPRSLGIKENIIVPSATTLRQNYPNPFNPSTTISFTLADDGHVTLKVYDLLGREISTLVDGMRPAGEYNVQFSPQASSGYSSGLYIYQLRHNSAVLTMKAVFVK